MDIRVLALNTAGLPISWLSLEDACEQYAKGHVVYDLGDVASVFRGGYQRDGVRSEIEINSIIAVNSHRNAFHNNALVPQRSSDMLYRRDHNICAYCGDYFPDRLLTRDHIHPQSRGGDNSWTNLVSCCFSCNNRKGDRTPEEAHMHLLYVPYKPCLYERFILKQRNILADQMEYLKAKLPKTSRHY